MTIQELILIDSDKVRRDSSLMAFYIESFAALFGQKPVCAGCSFNSDWVRFKNKVSGSDKRININSKTMTNTFKLKKIQNKILHYKAEGRTFRSYDNTMSEQFVTGFLTNGTEAEIAERKKLFSVLPDAFKGKVKEVKEPVKEVEPIEVEVENEIVFNPSDKLEEEVNAPKKKGGRPSKK